MGWVVGPPCGPPEFMASLASSCVRSMCDSTKLFFYYSKRSTIVKDDVSACLSCVPVFFLQLCRTCLSQHETCVDPVCVCECACGKVVYFLAFLDEYPLALVVVRPCRFLRGSTREYKIYHDQRESGSERPFLLLLFFSLGAFLRAAGKERHSNRLKGK